METTVFSLGDSKEASLYFDRVVPLALIVDSIGEFGRERFRDLFDAKNRAHWDALIEIRRKFDYLLPEHLNKDQDFLNVLADANMAVLYKIAESDYPDAAVRIKAWGPGPFPSKKARDAQIQACIRRANATHPTFTANAKLFSRSRSSSDDVMLSIANLNLIDTEKVTMEQILAFRGDPDARARLRRLRLFALGNYAGKTKSFIHDDLLARIDDYETETRRWSFETKNAAFSMLFNSKLLAGAAGGGVIGALMASPGLSLASLAVGTIAEFGRVGLEVSRRRFQQKDVLRGNPVSFINEAKKKLATPKKGE